MKRYQKLPKLNSDSHSGATCSDFKFPIASNGVQQNGVVFCGKLIICGAESSPILHQNKRQNNRFVAALRSPSSRESRCRRSGSESRNGSKSEGNKRSYTRMFSTIKFPIQMKLSDIKMRQKQMEPLSLPKLPTADDISRSCWKSVRSLRRKGTLMSALKASFGCFHVV